MSDGQQQQQEKQRFSLAEALLNKSVETEFHGALSDGSGATLDNIKSREDVVWLFAQQDKIEALLGSVLLTKREIVAVRSMIKSITLSQALGVPRAEFDDTHFMEYRVINLKAMLQLSRSDVTKGAFLPMAVNPEKRSLITVGKDNRDAGPPPPEEPKPQQKGIQGLVQRVTD